MSDDTSQAWFSGLPTAGDEDDYIPTCRTCGVALSCDHVGEECEPGAPKLCADGCGDLAVEIATVGPRDHERFIDLCGDCVDHPSSTYELTEPL